MAETVCHAFWVREERSTRCIAKGIMRVPADEMYRDWTVIFDRLEELLPCYDRYREANRASCLDFDSREVRDTPADFDLVFEGTEVKELVPLPGRPGSKPTEAWTRWKAALERVEAKHPVLAELEVKHPELVRDARRALTLHVLLEERLDRKQRVTDYELEDPRDAKEEDRCLWTEIEAEQRLEDLERLQREPGYLSRYAKDPEEEPRLREFPGGTECYEFWVYQPSPYRKLEEGILRVPVGLTDEDWEDISQQMEEWLESFSLWGDDSEPLEIGWVEVDDCHPDYEAVYYQKRGLWEVDLVPAERSKQERRNEWQAARYRVNKDYPVLAAAGAQFPDAVRDVRRALTLERILAGRLRDKQGDNPDFRTRKAIKRLERARKKGEAGLAELHLLLEQGKSQPA